MTDHPLKVSAPEEVAAKIVEDGLDGWYYDADGGWLRRKSTTDRAASDPDAGQCGRYGQGVLIARALESLRATTARIRRPHGRGGRSDLSQTIGPGPIELAFVARRFA